MKSTSNVFRFNNKYPFDNWTLKDGKLLGYYPRNSFINILSAKDNGIGVYRTYCVIRPTTKVVGRNCFKNTLLFVYKDTYAEKFAKRNNMQIEYYQDL